jgi:hypothetical protein
MVAAGGPPAIVRSAGGTESAAGAAPKLQRSMAPAQTCVGIGRSPHPQPMIDENGRAGKSLRAAAPVAYAVG